MNKAEAMEVFDGTMLGDNCIGLSRGRSPHMHISKSGEQYMPYLAHLKDVLSLLGVEFCTGHPKSLETLSSTGKPLTYCCLDSRVSSFFLEQRHRWYPSGKKIIPSDVRVTPISMAYEFSDDGSTSWHGGIYVMLKLYTNAYTKEGVYRLRDLIAAKFGVSFRLYPQPGWALWLSKVDEVNLFFDQIEEYILPCYRYKVKRPLCRVAWAKEYLR